MTKAYVCIFVCCAVKAVHLDLVSDLTSEAFIAALQRFISRRGDCLVIYSDHGTNFVDANNLLLCVVTETNRDFQLTWHFNPPAAPHFNGFAEAGVKSVKTHLSRVVGDRVLTYEEFYTLFTSIEALLNSRPICPLSSDPNDRQSLTPGHFLTMEPLINYLPEHNLEDVPLKRLSRWQLLQSIHLHFWQRWHREYFHTLQHRSTLICCGSGPQQIKVGALVLVKHVQKTPNLWELARIERVHPGLDGIIRVATLRGANGTFQRPICPLPEQ